VTDLTESTGIHSSQNKGSKRQSSNLEEQRHKWHYSTHTPRGTKVEVQFTKNKPVFGVDSDSDSIESVDADFDLKKAASK
jgi:hypothetical protein